MSFTPGPWRVELIKGGLALVEADLDRGCENPTICTLYEDVTPEDSVTIGPWFEPYDNAEANARLIAAAPTLANTCSAVLDLLLSDGYGETSLVVTKLRAVINQVKGEPNHELRNR